MPVVDEVFYNVSSPPKIAKFETPICINEMPGIWYTLREHQDPFILIWHWCVPQQPSRWKAAELRRSWIDSIFPLSVYPELKWPCCGLIGMIKDGMWLPAWEESDGE